VALRPSYSRKNERQLIRTMARAKLMETLDNETKNQLRQIAVDDGSPVVRRLHAIDRLACDGGVYNSAQYHTDVFIPSGTRAQRFVIHALRKVLKSDKPMAPSTASSIRERLTFIRTGRGLCDVHGQKWLWRVEPQQSKPYPQPKPEETLDQQIARILASQQNQNTGG